MEGKWELHFVTSLPYSVIGREGKYSNKYTSWLFDGEYNEENLGKAKEKAAQVLAEVREKTHVIRSELRYVVSL